MCVYVYMCVCMYVCMCVGVCVGGWVGGYETESDCTHTRPRLQVHCVISVRVHVDVADSLPSTGA